MHSHTSDPSGPTAKKQSKWSPEEDALIIELRGSGMKWDDISKRLPGRSPISCRLHYQNYLERRSEWDEERKNKLARLYERFKPEMWAKVAEEMQVPWRAAEAMHWQLGEAEMARRAGVVPFSLTSAGADMPPALPPPHHHQQRHSPTRGHGYSHSQGSMSRDLSGIPSPRSAGYGRGPPLSIPPPMPLAASSRGMLSPSRMHLGPEFGEPLSSSYGPSHGRPPPPHHHHPPPGLPPLQIGRGGGAQGMLPGVAELTTGVSPYSTPAYSTGGLPTGVSPVHSASASPGPPMLQSLSSGGGYPPIDAPTSSGSKRRPSPDQLARETSRRRHHHYGQEGRRS